MKSNDMLLVGDPHAHPNFDNARFSWLGGYIRETRPRIVLCVGDGADMPSLSRYDKGQLQFEGRRYAKDLASVHDAFGRVATELRGMRNRPKLIMLGGNHDFRRIQDAVAQHPELAGTLSVADLGYAELGWDVVPFREITSIEGFAACHYMEQLNSQREIGGANICRTLLNKGHESTIVGHCHLFQVASDATWTGRRINAITPGCFTHQNFIEDWSKQSVKHHWRGVVRLDGVANGDYESLQQISLSQLWAAYGG